MGNLIDIQTQIEKLQKQANDIKAKEFDRTVQEILAKMQAFGITTRHLSDAGKTKPRGGAKGPRAATAAPKAKKTGKTTVEPKFLGPAGETWSGRGLTPKWMNALIAEGRTKEEFAIK